MVLPRAARNLNLIKGPVSTADVPEWANGNITGVYALKNETGYVILGNLFGYYHKWNNFTGYYAGVWESLDGTESGGFAGWFIGHLTLGQFNETATGEEGGYIGLFRINETDSTIRSVAIAAANDDHFIRYSVCTYTEFE